MLNIRQLRSWLTLEETAEYFTKAFDADVQEADIYHLFSKEYLPLYLFSYNEIVARKFQKVDFSNFDLFQKKFNKDFNFKFNELDFLRVAEFEKIKILLNSKEKNFQYPEFFDLCLSIKYIAGNFYYWGKPFDIDNLDNNNFVNILENPEDINLKIDLRYCYIPPETPLKLVYEGDVKLDIDFSVDRTTMREPVDMVGGEEFFVFVEDEQNYIYQLQAVLDKNKNPVSYFPADSIECFDDAVVVCMKDDVKQCKSKILKEDMNDSKPNQKTLNKQNEVIAALAMSMMKGNLEKKGIRASAQTIIQQLDIEAGALGIKNGIISDSKLAEYIKDGLERIKR